MAYARVTVAEGSGDLIQQVQERVAPGVRSIAGVEAAYWLADGSKPGRIMGFVIFSDEQSLRDSAETAARMREAAGPDVTFTVDEYEVVAQV